MGQGRVRGVACQRFDTDSIAWAAPPIATECCTAAFGAPGKKAAVARIVCALKESSHIGQHCNLFEVV
jgi:hypothetical protein